ncbi:ABC transporter permease [Actinocrispum wychmicini]|uniref:Putative ABC transport system permease protein n=1 Tax=Actinocrispum wychmicini TaxID=1213861 RepID=A0A4R2J5F0_9PSEU|nr:FtsX-like permease family protein [Actinocrispum wychmicini]TCO53127.1 putative ABC transport system permease protein [Actinocrispum wychmicini]
MLKVSLRNLAGTKVRLLLSLLAIALSVAFVAGTLVLRDTIMTVTRAAAEAGAADVTVRPSSETETLTAAQAERVRRVDGVDAVFAEIDVSDVSVLDRRNQAVTVVKNAPTEAGNWQTTGRAPVRLAAGRAPAGDGEVMIDKDSAANSGVRIGDQVRVAATPGGFDGTVVGLAEYTTPNPGKNLVFLDDRTAATRLLGVPDGVTAIKAYAASGVSEEVLRQRIRSALGSSFDVLTKTQIVAESGVDDSVDLVTYVMLGFAGIAVLVGTFLIFNTFSMLIAARTRELGLLRAVGATGRQVRRAVVTEAFVLGLVGSTVGLALGIGAAAALRGAAAGFGLDLSSVALEVTPLAPIVSYLVGTIVTVASALLPARRAGRTTPIAALRVADLPADPRSRPRTLVGGALVVLGVAALATRSAGALVFGVAASLIGLVVLGPVLVRVALPVLGAVAVRLFGAVGRLGTRNTLRSTRRTAATAAALMIGVAVAAALSVVSASMSSSMADRIDRTLGADFTIVRSGKGQPPLTGDVAAAVRTVPGVGQVVRQRESRVDIVGGSRLTKGGWVQGVDPDFPAVFRQNYVSGSPTDSLASGKIVLSQSYAQDFGLAVGDRIDLRGPAGSATVQVGAIRAPDPPGMSLGRSDAPFVTMELLTRIAPAAQDALIMVNAAPGKDKTAVGAALTKALAGFPQASVRDQAAYKEFAQTQATTVLMLVYAMLGLAVLIAILGVINTLALSVLERFREIGMLRAVGLTRRQVTHMIGIESTVIALTGTALGLLLGLGWGVGAQQAMSSRGMEILAVPWLVVGAIVLAGVVAGLVAAIAPARRAARMDPVTAIATA